MTATTAHKVSQCMGRLRALQQTSTRRRRKTPGGSYRRGSLSEAHVMGTGWPTRQQRASPACTPIQDLPTLSEANRAVHNVQRRKQPHVQCLTLKKKRPLYTADDRQRQRKENNRPNSVHTYLRNSRRRALAAGAQRTLQARLQRASGR